MPGWVTGLVVAAALLVAATLFGMLWRRQNGRLRPVQPRAGEASVTDHDPVRDALRGLGVRAGTPATLVQFSSAFCAPCRATRRICAELADLLDGVRHIEVDAESHLDEVRALGVLRTPTLFIVDADTHVVQRASGLASKPHLVAALAPVLDAATPAPH